MAESYLNTEKSTEPVSISRRRFMQYIAGIGAYVLAKASGLDKPAESIAQEPQKTANSLDDILYQTNPTLALAIGVEADSKKGTENFQTGRFSMQEEFNVGATSFDVKNKQKVPFTIEIDYRTIASRFANYFTEEQKKGILAYASGKTQKVSSKECRYWPIALSVEQGKMFLIAGGYLLQSPDGKLGNNPAKKLHVRSGKDRPSATDLFNKGSGYAPRTIKCDDGTKQGSYFPAAFLLQPYYMKR
jgi:hypothetical protein